MLLYTVVFPVPRTVSGICYYSDYLLKKEESDFPLEDTWQGRDAKSHTM